MERDRNRMQWNARSDSAARTRCDSFARSERLRTGGSSRSDRVEPVERGANLALGLTAPARMYRTPQRRVFGVARGTARAARYRNPRRALAGGAAAPSRARRSRRPGRSRDARAPDIGLAGTAMACEDDDADVLDTLCSRGRNGVRGALAVIAIGIRSSAAKADRRRGWFVTRGIDRARAERVGACRTRRGVRVSDRRRWDGGFASAANPKRG